eukprot:8972123-Heterocapsa_arctica.AAC.1
MNRIRFWHQQARGVPAAPFEAHLVKSAEQLHQVGFALVMLTSKTERQRVRGVVVAPVEALHLSPAYLAGVLPDLPRVALLDAHPIHQLRQVLADDLLRVLHHTGLQGMDPLEGLAARPSAVAGVLVVVLAPELLQQL